jgi:hypothetical protein
MLWERQTLPLPRLQSFARLPSLHLRSCGNVPRFCFFGCHYLLGCYHSIYEAAGTSAASAFSAAITCSAVITPFGDSTYFIAPVLFTSGEMAWYFITTARLHQMPEGELANIERDDLGRVKLSQTSKDRRLQCCLLCVHSTQDQLHPPQVFSPAISSHSTYIDTSRAASVPHLRLAPRFSW